MAGVDRPSEFRVRDYLQECDAATLLRGASLRLNEELSLLQANALSAQETIDGFISTTGDAASAPNLAELLSQLRTATSSKSVAIEAALVQIDAALELVEELNNEAGTPLPHDCVEGVSRAPASEERVAALVQVVDALKHGGVIDAAADATLFVRVVASTAAGGASATLVTRRVSSSDVELRGLHASARPVVGRSLRFTIRYAPTLSPGLDPAASANAELAARTSIVVSGAAAGVLVAPLAAEGEGVDVTVTIPVSASVGDVLEITRVSVGGTPLDVEASGIVFPLRLPVVSVIGLVSPSEIHGALNGMMVNPCTSPAGELFLSVGDKVRIEGSRQCSFSVKPTFGVEKSHAVGLSDSSRTLLIAATSYPCVTAVDADTLAIRWRSPSEVVGTCRGIAVLEAAGVCVATLQEGSLECLRLSDGALLASVKINYPLYIAADSTTNTVYVSSQYVVESFVWDGASLRSAGRVRASDSGNNRPVAVVPPGPGHRHSHLVVGTCHSPSDLDVFRLPGLEFVCKTQLPDKALNLYGLVADATGTTLVAVVTRNNAALLMPWPLPGMPALL